MGGAIGFLLGTAMSAAGGYAQAKAQKQQQHDNLLLSTYQLHPELADTPDAQSFLKKKYGGDVADMFMNVSKASQQMQKEMTGAMGPSGAPPIASGQGAPVAPAAAPRAPGGPGLMMAAAPGAAPASAPAPTGAPAPAAPADDFASHIATINSEVDRLRGIQAKYAGNPEFQQKYNPVIEKHIDDLQKQRDQAISLQERQSEHVDTLSERQSEHQDTEADRAATRELAQQNKVATDALRQQGLDEQKQFKGFQEQHAKEQDSEKRDALAANQAKLIDASRDKLLGDFAKLPPDAKPAAEARVKGYNAQAAMFYRKHAGAGAPTLLNFNPGNAGSGLRGVAGLGEASAAPSIEAVPPTYGTYKGKSGFIDADGYFYPDQN